MKELTGEHAFVHENMAAYLAGGLESAERGRFDGHVNNCPECFDAFSEARDADRGMQRVLSALMPGEGFEERMTGKVRRVIRWRHPAIRRVGYATAAAVALAATGLFANVAMRQNGRFNNPLTVALAAQADGADTEWGNKNQALTSVFRREDAGTAYAPAGTTANMAADDGRTMRMRYNNAPVETVLTDLSQNFGFVVVKSVQVPQRVTIEVPDPVNRRDALKLLNSALSPLGYTTLATRTSNGPDAKTVLHVASTLEVMKAQIPVREGSDPNDIPLTDEIITQIIPLKNVSAASLRSDLTPMISSNADVTVNNASNAIVVTDTSAQIHRLTEIIQKLDNQKTIKTVIEYRQLMNSNAADAARLVNSTMNPSNTGQRAAGGSAGGGAGLTALNGHLHADADARTNTVVLNGPADMVVQAQDMLSRLESIPADYVGKSNGTIRQSIDTTEHLIPYADLMTYPDNWPEITRQRAGGAAGGDAIASFADASQPGAKSFAQKTDPSQPGGQNIVTNFNQTVASGGFNGKATGGQREVVDRTTVPGQVAGTPVPTARPAVPQDIGGSALVYSYDQKALQKDGVGFAYGVQGGKSVDVNGNALTMGLLGAADFGIAGSEGKLKTFDVRDALVANNNVQAPRVNLSSGGGQGGGSGGFGSSDARWIGGVAPTKTDEAAFSGNASHGIVSASDTNGLKIDAGKTASSDAAVLGGGKLTINGTQALHSSAGGENGQNVAVGDAHAEFNKANNVAVLGDMPALDTFWSIPVNGEHDKSATKQMQDTLNKKFSDDKIVAAGVQPGMYEEQVKGVGAGASAQGSSDMPQKLLSSDGQNGRGGMAAGDNAEGPAGKFSMNAGIADVEKPADPAGGNHYMLNRTDISFQKDSELNRPDASIAMGTTPTASALPEIRFNYSNSLAMATQPAPATPGTPAGGAVTSTAPAVSLAVTQDIQSLKIIRNGRIDFEVRSFDDAYQHVREIVTLEKGYVSSTSSEKLANGHVRGTIVVRMPPENLDNFLRSLRALGDLKAQQIGAADVTKDYYDIQARLHGKETMEARLLDLIKNGKGEVKDLIEAEKQLGDTRVEIEQLKGNISYYNNLVSLATITITAYEKDIASPTAASQQENVNVNVESEEVEAKYGQARKIFEDAKGHIVESQLKNADADHVAAHIVADVPPAQADFVANQLKQLGKVASFNRDRRQTTTGGTGAPTPGVQVDEKDTHFTVELFNLANLNPRETTVLRVAVKDVESSYKSILELIKQPLGEAAPAAAGAAGAAAPAAATQAAGRIYASNLTGQQPEQMSADISSQVRAESADAILAALRGAGVVLTSQLNTNQDPNGTTSAKRGIQVTLVNIASVSAKEADNLTIAVKDVDAAYKAALASIRKDAPAPPPPPAGSADLALLPGTVGRVLSASMTGQQPLQLSAEIRAEIRADQDADLVAALKKVGEVVGSTSSENQDTVNVTRAKRALYVHFVNVASISPREVQALHAVSANVAESYKSLNAALQDLSARGEVRIINSNFSDADPRSVNASLTFEAQKTSVDAVEKAFTAAGLEFPSRSVARVADGGVALDSKVGYQIADIRSAETLDPRRTVTESIEVGNVEDAVNKLRKSVLPMTPKVKESDFTVTRDADTGLVKAHIVLDAYVSVMPSVLASVGAIDGTQKSYQESSNAQAPETKSFTKERVDLWVTSKPLVKPILEADKGFGSSARAALTSALGALFMALYFVLTGVLFLAPFVLIGWPIWAVMKRRRRAAKA